MAYCLHFLPDEAIRLIYQFDNTYYNEFSKNLKSIIGHKSFLLRNEGRVYPFKLNQHGFTESGFLIKLESPRLDNYVLQQYQMNLPTHAFYKLSWNNYDSRRFIITIITNKIGYNHALPLVTEFAENDVFIMIFTENYYYDRTVQKVFVYDNEMFCPDWTKESILLKIEVGYETLRQPINPIKTFKLVFQGFR
jgi:hypothetical protein